MSKKIRISLQANLALPRLAFLARVVLHVAVLFVVGLFPSATPGFGLLAATEFEAPMDQDESSGEEAISVLARTRARREQPGSLLLAPVRCGTNLSAASRVDVPRSGHRLPNNLLAPLRC